MARKKKPDKLSQEVAQALAAGMSYGKWKAMQPVINPPPRKAVETFTEYTCAFCGSKFVRYDKKVCKYCGDRCRQLAYEKSRREKKLAGGAE